MPPPAACAPPHTPAPTPTPVREQHHARFRGPVEPAGATVALVHGNCQAESLRVVLDGGELTTVRLPPVHELTADDLPHLRRWLRRADLLVTQPVRDGFGGLPLGSAQLAAQLAPRAIVVRVPVVRFAGLFPTHAIIRPPGDRSLVPPLAPYHDLRVLAEAAARRARVAVRRARLDRGTVRAVAAHSLAALRRREAAHGTVVASDLLAAPSFALMRTLNHPANPIWLALAERVRRRAGLPAHDGDPGRPLLDAIHAPRDPEVVAAFGLDEEPRVHWLLDGAPVPVAAVREAHLAWYERHPDAVDAGLARHGDVLALLGLG